MEKGRESGTSSAAYPTSVIRSKNSITGGSLISIFLSFIRRVGDK